MAEIGAKIDQDMIAAMRAKDAPKLSTLRMMKSVLKGKEIDKRQPLTDGEEQLALTTMLKQRRESIEMFTKGGREDLAANEAREVTVIESYMPKAAGAEELLPIVQAAIATVVADNGGTPATPRDMGTVMKIVQQRLFADGIRADGRLLSGIVKDELAKS